MFLSIIIWQYMYMYECTYMYMYTIQTQASTLKNGFESTFEVIQILKRRHVHCTCKTHSYTIRHVVLLLVIICCDGIIF